MTNEELCQRIRKGQRHLQTDLFLQNENFLRQFANKYSFGDPQDYDDLMQELSIMLFRCADKFVVNHNSRATFLTFARPWLQQACLKYVEHRNMIYIPPDRSPLLRKYRSLKEQGLNDTEIMNTLHLVDRYQLEEIERESTMLLPTASLSAPIGEDTSEGEITLADTIPDMEDRFLEIEDCLERARLSRMIGEIQEPHRSVLYMYFFQEFSLSKIGEQLHVSRQRAGILLSRAKKILEEKIFEYDSIEVSCHHGSHLSYYKAGTPLSVVEEVALSRVGC